MRTKLGAAVLVGASLLLSGCGAIVGGGSPPISVPTSPPQTMAPPTIPPAPVPPTPTPEPTPTPTPEPTPTPTATPTATPSASPSPTATPSPQAAAPLSIVNDTVKDGAYEPAMLTVAAGQPIQVTNDDRFLQHDARFRTAGGADAGGTAILQPGAGETVAAPAAAGSYEVFCTLHPRMAGTLVVQ